MNESETIYADILIELECPICTEYMTPPIRQCEIGHSICEPCMKKLQRCPLCKTNFIKAKNIALQALAYKVRYPCVHELKGCNEKFKLEQRKKHEKKCAFAGYYCAMISCPWVGNFEDIVEHWISKGKSLSNPSGHSYTSMTVDSYLVNLTEDHNQLFWKKRKLENGKIYWAVQLIGHADKACNYFYEIDIYQSENSKCRIILRDYCKPVEVDNKDLFSEDVCITTISTERLKQFINEYQTLTYFFRIHKI